MAKILVREVLEKDKAAFNKAVDHPVQSWEWGEFRQKAGNKVVRLGAYNGNKLIEGYQLTIHKIPHSPYSVGMFTQGPKPSQHMIEALKGLAKVENLIFVRMEPKVAVSDKAQATSIELLRENGCKKGRPFFNKSTYIVNLEKSEDELLKAMHPKARYNIRVAEKHGVEVKEDNSDQAFEEYLNLMDETTKRQGYMAHTERYHRRMWEMFKPSGMAHLLTATFQNKTLATWIIFSWHDTIYYPYGASSGEHREVMAPTKMMWEAIKFGKKLGAKKFDLWGADEGTGYAKFKQNFSPDLVETIGTWDLITNKKLYQLYRVAEEVRWRLLKTKAKVLPGKSSFR